MVGWCSMGTFNDPCLVWHVSNPVNWHQLTSMDMVSQYFSSEWYHDVRGIPAYHQLHQLRMSMIFAQVFWRISPWKSFSNHFWSMIFQGFFHGFPLEFSMDFPRFTEALKLEMARKAASEEELLRLQDEEPGAAERGWRNAMEIAIYMVYCNIYIYINMIYMI